MAHYLDEAQRLQAAGLSTREIARKLFPNEPEETARSRVKKALHRAKKPFPGLRGIEAKTDGTTTFTGVVELNEGELITPEIIMRAHSLNVADWEVISYKSNYWQSQAKGGRKIDLYQSKITVKPRKDSLRLEDIEAFFANLKFDERTRIKPAQYSADGEILEICVPDLHSGLFSWRHETGEDYDHNITRERFTGCMADIMARCKGRKFSKVLFVTLGDLLHVDNDRQETTKGTFQQVDGRFSKFFLNTLDLLVDAITALEQIAPVEVVYIQGNHDGITGFTLLQSVKMAFRNDRNVTVDTEPNPRKWRRIGENLIGWCHGDMPAKNRSTWLHQEAREEYGQTKYAEIHAGHLHSQQTVEGNGLIYRSLPTICGASAWEHHQAFGKSHRCVMSFVWAPSEAGPREIWYSNIQNKRREPCG